MVTRKTIEPLSPDEIATATIVIRRQWNDWRKATVPLRELDNPHWDCISGGINAPSPRPFIHAYIFCTQVISGELAHSCEHGPPPHRIKVCVVKKDNEPKIFAYVKAIADTPETGFKGHWL